LNSNTSVVFVTGKATQERAFAAGGCGFLSKPISSKMILLTALTFTLRARASHPRTAPALEATAR
jgi:CheY-like chemotaxis protein